MKLKQRAVNDILAANSVPSIDGIIVLDSHGVILAFDNAAQSLFGYREEDIIGQPIDILMSYKQAKTHPEFFKQASTIASKANQRHKEKTIIGRHSLGHSIPIVITVSHDKSAKDLRFIGVIQDMRKHEAQLSTVFQDFQATTDELNLRIEFEGLLNTHGNYLLSCSADSFHNTMENTLEAVGIFLELDNGFIIQVTEDLSEASLWAEWRRSTSLMVSFPEHFQIPNSHIFLNALDSSDTITIRQDSQDDDKVLFHLAQELSPNGFHTSHITPIMNNIGVIIGVIGFSALDPNHTRPDSQLPLLKLATQLIINAWERNQLIIQAQIAEKNIQEKNKELADKASFSQALLKASNILYLSSHEDIRNGVQTVLSQAASISGHQQVLIYFEHDNMHQVHSFIQQHFDTSLQNKPLFIEWVNKHLEDNELLQVNKIGELNLTTQQMHELKQYNIQAFTAVKLKKGSLSMGFVIFYNSLPIVNSNEEALRFLQLTGQNLAAAIQQHSIQFDLELSEQKLSHANRLLAQQAFHDSLTGLANRRAFDSDIVQEFERARRHGNNLTLLMCDIDYFKYYNDHFGHTKGDACLQQVAKVLLRTFSRAGEICTRYGGEEFAIILPSIDRIEAGFQAQRLLDNLNLCKIEHAPKCPFEYVSLSIGIAQLTPEHNYDNIIELIDGADKALYQAKNNGRNQLAWALKEE